MRRGNNKTISPVGAVAVVCRVVIAVSLVVIAVELAPCAQLAAATIRLYQAVKFEKGGVK